MARHTFLLVTLLIGTLLANVAHAEARGGRIPIVWTTGEVITDLDGADAATRSKYGDNVRVGFIHRERALFGVVPVWKSAGRFCLYIGDRYTPISAEEAARRSASSAGGNALEEPDRYSRTPWWTWLLLGLGALLVLGALLPRRQALPPERLSQRDATAAGTDYGLPTDDDAAADEAPKRHRPEPAPEVVGRRRHRRKRIPRKTLFAGAAVLLLGAAGWGVFLLGRSLPEPVTSLYVDRSHRTWPERPPSPPTPEQAEAVTLVPIAQRPSSTPSAAPSAPALPMPPAPDIAVTAADLERVLAEVNAADGISGAEQRAIDSVVDRLDAMTRRDQPAAATVLLRALLDRHPDQPRALYLLARLRLDAGDTTEADGLLQRLRPLQPDLADHLMREIQRQR